MQRRSERCSTCFPFRIGRDFLNHYGTRFELGNLQSRALARLLSCVAAHPGGDPTGICTAGEMSIYMLARNIDLSINGLAEQGGK